MAEKKEVMETGSVDQRKDLNKKEVRNVVHGGGRSRGASAAEKSARYSRYRAIKRRAIELEKQNKEYLILWPASDVEVSKKKFYNMGGMSAIVYVHEIGPRIGRKPVLRRDMDSCNPDEKFNMGICSIADINLFETKLAEINIPRIPFEDEIIIFKLKRTYSKADIKTMLKCEQAKEDSLNKLIYSEVLYPDIHKLIIELKKMVPAKVKNMDSTYRNVIGMEMIKSLMIIVRAYTLMAHGEISEEEAAESIMRESDMMLSEISLFNELKVWEVSACMRLANTLVGLRMLVKGRIINQEKNPESNIKPKRKRYENYK